MLSRRDLLMSVPVASRLRPGDAPAESSIDVSGIVSALQSLRHLTPSPEIKQIQALQRLHFKLTQKFPNYIDVGYTVWENLTMWHYENRIPLKMTRTVDGRMEMEFNFTTLVLKSDLQDTLMSTPYD
jgi:hypothetical protein